MSACVRGGPDHGTLTVQDTRVTAELTGCRPARGGVQVLVRKVVSCVSKKKKLKKTTQMYSTNNNIKKKKKKRSSSPIGEAGHENKKHSTFVFLGKKNCIK